MRALTMALLPLTTALSQGTVQAQSVAWPAFVPIRSLLRFDGFTDTLPDFIGPIDGTVEAGSRLGSAPDREGLQHTIGSSTG